MEDTAWELSTGHLHPRKNRFSERNWVQSSNDHGSEPILERFSTYLERHAMFCAVGELMRTRPLAAPSAGSEDEMESWLRRRASNIGPIG